MRLKNISIILTFLVIAISGNPAVGFFGKENVYVGVFAIFLGVWFFRTVKLTRLDIKIYISFFFIIVSHILSFGFSVLTASLGFLIVLGIGLLSVRLIAEFFDYYVSIMYALSIISFVFFVPVVFGIDMQGLFSAIRIPLGPESIDYHIGVHNLRREYDDIIRNMGMFWEPGAFAGYLILALLFMVREGTVQSVKSRRGLIIIIALLSTQSTTGYLSLMLLAIYYMYKSDWAESKRVKFLVLPFLVAILAGGGYVVSADISFLGEKISSQFEEASDSSDAGKINRFGNFIYDLEWIYKRPVFGWSATPATRISVDSEVAELVSGQGNGLTGFTVKFGLIGMFIYIGFVAYTARRLTGSLIGSLFTVGVVCALLNGEQFLNYPLFLSLMFLPKNASRQFHVLPPVNPSGPSIASKIPGYSS